MSNWVNIVWSGYYHCGKNGQTNVEWEKTEKNAMGMDWIRGVCVNMYIPVCKWLMCVCTCMYTCVFMWIYTHLCPSSLAKWTKEESCSSSNDTASVPFF